MECKFEMLFYFFFLKVLKQVLLYFLVYRDCLTSKSFLVKLALMFFGNDIQRLLQELILLVNLKILFGFLVRRPTKNKSKKTPYCYFAVPDDDTTHVHVSVIVLTF